MPASTGSRSSRQTVSAPPWLPVRVQPALHWVQWSAANPSGVFHNGWGPSLGFIMMVLRWWHDRTRDAAPRLVFGDPASQVLAGIVTQPEIVVSDGCSCDPCAPAAPASPPPPDGLGPGCGECLRGAPEVRAQFRTPWRAPIRSLVSGPSRLWPRRGFDARL